MNSQYFEKRLKEYKEQRYQLMVTKFKLENADVSVVRKDELKAVVEKSIGLVEAAISSTTRIVEYAKEIDKEKKGYQIIDMQLQEVMLDYQLVTASTQLASQKVYTAGETLADYAHILKHKKKK